MKQTKVNDHNREDFYINVYPMQKDSKEDLIDISGENRPIVAIDCCGWYYSKIFNRSIIMVETLTSAKNYKLSQNQYTKLIDDRNDKLVWPKITNVVDPVVLLDRSPILKYLTIDEFMFVVNDIIGHYSPSKVFIRGNLQFIDDSRMQDRIRSWFSFLNIPNFVTVIFHYNTETMLYEINLKRCV